MRLLCSEGSYREEEPLPVDSTPKPQAPQIITGHHTVVQKISCLYHRKDSRFEVHYYEREKLLVIYCVACHPRNELLRAKIAEEPV